MSASGRAPVTGLAMTSPLPRLLLLLAFLPMLYDGQHYNALFSIMHSRLFIVKVLVGAFNMEKALVGALSSLWVL